MTDKSTGGPAFPQPCDETGACSNNEYGQVGGGVTLRDYFAAHAPVTMSDAELAIKAIGESNYTGEQLMKMLCSIRWLYADTMLEARND